MIKRRTHDQKMSAFRDRSFIRDCDPRRSNVHVVTHKLVDITRSQSDAISRNLSSSVKNVCEQRRRQREKSRRDATSVETRATKF